MRRVDAAPVPDRAGARPAGQVQRDDATALRGAIAQAPRRPCVGQAVEAEAPQARPWPRPRAAADVRAMSGRVAWKAVSNTATCRRCGRAPAIARAGPSVAGWWSGAERRQGLECRHLVLGQVDGRDGPVSAVDDTVRDTTALRSSRFDSRRGCGRAIGREIGRVGHVETAAGPSVGRRGRPSSAERSTPPSKVTASASPCPSKRGKRQAGRSDIEAEDVDQECLLRLAGRPQKNGAWVMQFPTPSIEAPFRMDLPGPCCAYRCAGVTLAHALAAVLIAAGQRTSSSNSYGQAGTWCGRPDSNRHGLPAQAF